MSEADNLKELGVVEDPDQSSMGRRIEWMSRRQTLITIILFAFCNIILIMFMIFSPPLFITQIKEFTSNIDSSASNKFQFKFKNLKYFNSFITLDLRFNQTYYDVYQPNDTHPVKLLTSGNFKIGNTIIDTIPINAREYNITFNKDVNMSDKLRLLAKGYINFDTIDYSVAITQPPGYNLPGEFIWNFAEPSYSILLFFLRLVFCILSIFIYIRLLLSDAKYDKSNIIIKMVFHLSLLLVFACDPFFILAYLTQTPFFNLFDICLSFFTFTYTAFVALISLSMRNLRYRDYSKIWIIFHYLPFFATFIFFTINSSFNVIQVNKDPMSKVTPLFLGFGILKFVVAGVYLLSIVIHIFLFKTDIPNEKPAYSLMSLIFFITVLCCELYNVLNPYLGTDSAAQSFTLIATAIYIFFYLFINWPVEPSEITNPDVEAPLDPSIQIVNE